MRQVEIVQRVSIEYNEHVPLTVMWSNASEVLESPVYVVWRDENGCLELKIPSVYRDLD
jgi:hypothetical protein